ncbi:MAG TPA: PP2C family protein-serine/threonine phosphatase [Vicinamibacterales bacterium]|nr:PP2C family protein-serine/threonine phosphatase [Vicinamibacterales bacterium]
MSDEPQHMSCMEVWGGSQLSQRSVQFSGLEAWVYSKPHGQASKGGDVVYASSCATGRITRLLLADVAGHGQTVAGTAADLRLLMRRFVNRLDQTELVRLLNQQFSGLSERAVFATAIVTTFFAPTRRLIVCNAGHPRPLIYRADMREWNVLGQTEEAPSAGPRNLPLGILSVSDYDQFDIELQEGDCIVAYTDALIEAQDADGDELGEAGVQRILQLMGEVDAPSLIPTLLGEIADRFPENLSADDVTVLVVRATSKPLRHSLVDQLRALARLIGSTIGAIRPGAERPPFPDLNAANICGPIMPALERRWRKGG